MEYMLLGLLLRRSRAGLLFGNGIKVVGKTDWAQFDFNKGQNLCWVSLLNLLGSFKLNVFLLDFLLEWVA